ncbi:site-specific integrase [Fusobacterium sp.]|uniref:site-specific integrase n=1 Tax=Fusobacterium sp. TaxID=68766 RepID=UPI0025BA5F8D|nr:site-specific integrase [Fusobacterium sp.]MCI5725544.1 site-specific integrase [Fusobacterium sp.]MCI7222893.1 site-specific integrase [Fusobacterium sp.]
MPANKNVKTGKWDVNFYCKINNKNQKIHKRGFETKKKALDFEREYILKNAGSMDMTFTSLVEKYFEDIEKRLKYNTLINKKNKIRQWILPYLASKKLSEISISDIREIQNNLLSSNLKSSSKNLINSYLSSIFDYSQKYYNMKFDFVVEKNIAKRDFITEKTIITQEQFKILLGTENKEIYKIAITILFWTGIRAGELLALKFGDFDIINKKLRINKSCCGTSKKNKIITTTKSLKSNRSIDIGNDVIEAYKKLKELTYDKDDENFLFPNITQTIFSNYISKLGKKCNIEKLSPHSFRHSHTSYLLDKGVNILVISKRLGHQNVSTTLDIYSHVLDDMKNKLLEYI